MPRSPDRLVAGVAGGWADRWGVEPTVVRAAIGLLTLAGGIGAVLYGSPRSPRRRPRRSRATPDRVSRDHRRHLAIASATAAILVAARAIGLWPGDGIMLPAAAAAVGTAAAWMHGAIPRAASPNTWLRRSIQIVAGVTLLGAGVVSLASRTGGLANVGTSTSAIAVVVGGLAMFGAPAFGRILRYLDEERSMRIREDERATVAAHLHDSVLQSLVLIQRSDDPRRMASLARRQERELRAWLYDRMLVGEPASLHAAIEALDDRDRDRPRRPRRSRHRRRSTARRGVEGAASAAIREALVNAARHADVDRVDVFVEADDAELTGFVRDTGCGFDRAQIPDDRRGINDSIVGRVQRVGGTAVLTSQPGVGTEVELRVPRRRQ